MKSIIKIVGIITMLVLIVLSITNCGESKQKNIQSITRFLEKHEPTSAENPANLAVEMILGNLESADSGWGQLMNALSTWGGYVNLDISTSTMSTSTFNPGRNIYDKIVSVVLPDMITEIADLILQNWTGIPSISFTDKNTAYSVIDGVIYSKDQKTIVRAPRVDGSVIIPDGVINIRNNAFLGCWEITSVTIPASVTNIGFLSFGDCHRLANVTFLGNISESNFDRAAFGTRDNYISNLRDEFFSPNGGPGNYTRMGQTMWTWRKQ